jgi:ppGpp synthetase/RelA/SpoT-type nucleotidyltranferase
MFRSSTWRHHTPDIKDLAARKTMRDNRKREMDSGPRFPSMDEIDKAVLLNELYNEFRESKACIEIMERHRLYKTKDTKAAVRLKRILAKLPGQFTLSGLGPLFLFPDTRVKTEDSVTRKLFRYAYETVSRRAKMPLEMVDRHKVIKRLTNPKLIRDSYRGIPDLVGGRICVPILGVADYAVGKLKIELESGGYLQANGFPDNDYLRGRQNHYYAYHFYIILPRFGRNPGRRFRRVAEIQVITLLCNAWADLAHGLCYKPQDVFFVPTRDNFVYSDMNSVCDILHGVDELATTVYQRVYRNPHVSIPGRAQNG